MLSHHTVGAAFTARRGQFPGFLVGLLLLAAFAVAPAWAQTTNQLTLGGAPSGSQPGIQANGVDTNISILLTPKGTGGVGIGTTAPLASLDLSQTTDGILVPRSGTDPTCNATTSVGMVRYNSTTTTFEGCDGTGWYDFGGALGTFDKGSAAAPGWAVTQDTTTGLFQATSTTLSVATEGTEAARFLQTASAVDYLTLTGSTTGNAATGPILSVAGTDTNVGLKLNTKGTGAITLATGGGTQVQVLNTASAVDYLTFTGAAASATASVAIGAAGTDTNINILLSPKGSGNVGIGTTGPVSMFHVYQSNASGPVEMIRLDNPNTGGGSGEKIGFYGYNGQSQAAIVNVVTPGSGGSTISFQTAPDYTGQAPTTQMSILPSGVVSVTSAMNIGSNTGFTGHRLQLIGAANTAGTDANLEIGDGATVYWRLARNSGNSFQTNMSSTWGIMGGNVGIGTTAPRSGVILDLGSNTNSMLLPIGTTNQRPTGIAGMVRFNSSTSSFEGYDGSNWYDFGSSIDTFAAGSAPAPGLAVETDATTGLFQATSTTLSIATEGTEAARFLQTASAVDYLTLTGSTTGNAATGPILGVAGTDTNVGLKLNTKGTGALTLATGGGTQAQILNTASAVDYLTFTGGVTGSPGSVAIVAAGSDANVNLVLSQKGTGSIGIGTTSPSAVIDIEGGTAAAYLNGGNLMVGGQSGGAVCCGSADNGGNILLIPGVGKGSGSTSPGPSGSIGLGTTTPKSTVDIAGSLSVGSYGGVTAAPTNGLIVSGSVGIGTSSLSSLMFFDVEDDITPPSFTSGASIELAAQNGSTACCSTPANGGNIMLLPGAAGNSGIPGAVLIGTTTPSTSMFFDVENNVMPPHFGSGAGIKLAAQGGNTGCCGGVANGGNIVFIPGAAGTGGVIGGIGINTTAPKSMLDVAGSASLGSYGGSTAAPSNGLIVSGNVGIGTTTPQSKLDVYGGISIGTSYAGVTAAPTNGAIIQGNVGIGTTVPGTNATLAVNGGLAVGTYASNATTAINNGIIVSGTVAIGTSAQSTGTVLDLGSNTTSLLLPTGTTNQRPTGIAGMLRYNSTLQQIEAYYNSVWNALSSPNVQVFTTAGANTYTWSAAYTRIEVLICGAGGGGGGGSKSSFTTYVGGGGGGGGCQYAVFKGSDIGANQTVTIGTGGTGGAGSTTTAAGGSPGGNSTFGSFLTGYGGGGGGASGYGGSGGDLYAAGVTNSATQNGFGGAGQYSSSSMTTPTPLSPYAGAGGSGGSGGSPNSEFGGPGGGNGTSTNGGSLASTVGGQSLGCQTAPSAGTFNAGTNGGPGGSTAASFNYLPGCGGGGGGGSNTANGGVGGAGTNAGGGGGGGGTNTGTTGGAGGAGGNGYAVIRSW